MGGRKKKKRITTSRNKKLRRVKKKKAHNGGQLSYIRRTREEGGKRRGKLDLHTQKGERNVCVGPYDNSTFLLGERGGILAHYKKKPRVRIENLIKTGQGGGKCWLIARS